MKAGGNQPGPRQRFPDADNDHQQDEPSRQDEQPVPALPVGVGQGRLFDGIVLAGLPSQAPIAAPVARSSSRHSRE